MPEEPQFCAHTRIHTLRTGYDNNPSCRLQTVDVVQTLAMAWRGWVTDRQTDRQQTEMGSVIDSNAWLRRLHGGHTSCACARHFVLSSVWPHASLVYWASPVDFRKRERTVDVAN